jgi:hypothetical protein
MRISLTVVSLALLLGACSDIYTERRETIGLSAGDAQATNAVAMMVDPWPVHSANRNIAFNGEKMQSAVERYRTNRVIQPVNATTSSVAYQQAQQAAATANAAQTGAVNMPVQQSASPAGFWSSNSNANSGSNAAQAPMPSVTTTSK